MKPLAVKILFTIAWLSVGTSVFIFGISVAAAAVQPGEGVLRAFLGGVVGTLGYEHASFGGYEAGRVTGTLFIAVLPALLLLCAGKYRYLWLIRSAAITWVLFAFVAGSHLLLPFIATLVSFLPSVRHYCQGTVPGENSP